MAQKRQLAAPLPIFNKSKRPRLALVAHPGNTELDPSPANSWSKPDHVTGSFKRPSYMYNTQPPTIPRQQRQQENYLSGHLEEQAHSQMNHFTAYQPLREHTQHSLKQTYSSHSRPFANSVPTHTKHSSSVSHISATAPVGSTAVGHAHEPTPSQRAHVDKSAPAKESSKTVQRSRPTLRLLTATAQGMKYWAKYKSHTPLLFEIFGILSPPGVTAAGNKCKQFTIETSDGPVRCQFWEIDRSLPPLAVRRGYRVVGQWDDRVGVVKCFSVRCVRVGEVEAGGHGVQASDRTMRQFVSKINES